MVSANTRKLQLKLIDEKNKPVLVAKHSVSINLQANNDPRTDINFDQLTLPYKCEIELMNVGKNHAGYIDEQEMQMSYLKWEGTDIIDLPHDKSKKKVTEYSMSNIKGNIKEVNFDENTGVLYGIAEIYDKYIAYLMYMGKCKEVSVEYAHTINFENGMDKIIGIKPKVVALVKKGEMKHSSIKLMKR